MAVWRYQFVILLIVPSVLCMSGETSAAYQELQGQGEPALRCTVQPAAG